MILRSTRIGSSDVPAVLGISPWKSPADVIAEKLGTRPSENKVEMGVGNKLERPIAELNFPHATLHPGSTYVHEDGWRSATPDFWIPQDPEAVMLARGEIYGPKEATLVEVKNVGFGQLPRWKFGEVCPDFVRAQVQWQMAVLGHKRVRVATLLGGSFPKAWKVKRDDAWIAEITKICRVFWEENLAPDRRKNAKMREMAALFKSRRRTGAK